MLSVKLGLYDVSLSRTEEKASGNHEASFQIRYSQLALSCILQAILSQKRPPSKQACSIMNGSSTLRFVKTELAASLLLGCSR